MAQVVGAYPVQPGREVHSRRVDRQRLQHAGLDAGEARLHAKVLKLGQRAGRASGQRVAIAVNIASAA
ncbi:MAG: hypothetical protein B7X42_07895, partial [Thiomonas sp. 14-66-4]